MKAILEFNFNEENNDRTEFQDAVDGTKWKHSVWEMDQWLRGNIKHAPDDISDDTYKAFELCREQLHEFINNNNLDLNF